MTFYFIIRLWLVSIFIIPIGNPLTHEYLKPDVGLSVLLFSLHLNSVLLVRFCHTLFSAENL